MNFISSTAEAATVICFHIFEMYKDRQQALTLQKLPKLFLITFLNVLNEDLRPLIFVIRSRAYLYFQHCETVMVYYLVLDRRMSVIYNFKLFWILKVFDSIYKAAKWCSRLHAWENKNLLENRQLKNISNGYCFSWEKE